MTGAPASGQGTNEADSVAHCGSSLAGDFVWSLTYTCLGSGWTEGRAVWNKGAAGVVEQTRDVELSLPSALLPLRAWKQVDPAMHVMQ